MKFKFSHRISLLAILLQQSICHTPKCTPPPREGSNLQISSEFRPSVKKHLPLQIDRELKKETQNRIPFTDAAFPQSTKTNKETGKNTKAWQKLRVQAKIAGIARSAKFSGLTKRMLPPPPTPQLWESGWVKPSAGPWAKIAPKRPGSGAGLSCLERATATRRLDFFSNLGRRNFIAEGKPSV